MLVTAGFGTRLSPFTDLLPKPAVPVGNRPVAYYALDHLARAGVREVVLNTHHLASQLEAAVRATAPAGLGLRFVHEPEILGTGGGVHNAWQPRDSETFVVMNGKLLFAPDLAAALALHTARNAFATMVVKWVPDNDPTAVVEVDASMNVRGLPGYNAPLTGPARRCMYTGVSLLSAAAHAELPERGCLIREGYARWIEQGRPVVAHADDAVFRDVGMSHAHYLEANLALATGLVQWPGIERDARGIVDATARFGEDAQCIDSVIGAHVELAPSTALERCVVWAGARVAGSHRDSVILPDGRVIPVQPKP